MSIPVIMGQVLGFMALALLAVLIFRQTHRDVTLISLLVGFVFGQLVPVIGWDTGLRAGNIKDLVFYVVLPLLIFEAAWHINFDKLKHWLLPASLLASCGVMITMSLTAVGLYYAIGHPSGFPWVAAFLAGAILAATDPVAVVAKLRKEQAPEDLSVLFEGESFLNDAVAVVLFATLITLALNAGVEGSTSWLLVNSFVGGVVIGWVLGSTASRLVTHYRDDNLSIPLLIFTAFASFYCAERLFHVSGVIAVAVAAMVCRSNIKASLSKRYDNRILPLQQALDGTWNWLGLLMNCLLFIMMGLVVGLEMFTHQWLAVIVAILVVSLARIVAVYFCGALAAVGRRPIPKSWLLILSLGGLRGGVALALALSLPVQLSYWWTLQSMVFGVVLFTLLVQGPTASLLIKRLQS